MTHSMLDVLENLLTLEVYFEKLVHVALTHRDFLSHEHSFRRLQWRWMKSL